MIQLLLASALFAGQAHASDPCSGVNLAEDKFTHQQAAKVQGGVFSLGWILGWEADFTNGAAVVKFNLPSSGVHQEVLTAGFPVKFLMDDESVVELHTSEDTQPAPGASSSGVYTLWTASFPLDKASATALAAQHISAVRVTLPTGDATWTVTGRSAKSFSKAFGCYASLLP